MTDAYYEPHPLWVLPRPLVIAGLVVGTGARAIARIVAGRTGLPLVDVDRRVEHATGTSLEALLHRGGTARLAAEARDVLVRARSGRPPALVAIGFARPHAPCASLFGDSMDLVCVSRAPAVVERRRQQIVEQEPGIARMLGLVDGARATDRAPGPLERSLLLEAGICFEAGESHAHEIAEGLIESLAHVVDAERV